MADYSLTIDLSADNLDGVEVLSILRQATQLVGGEHDVEITGASMFVYPPNSGEVPQPTPLAFDPPARVEPEER